MKKWLYRGLTLGLLSILPVVNDVPAADGASDQSAKQHPSRHHAQRKRDHHRRKGVGARKQARLETLRSKKISGSLSDREQVQLTRVEPWSARRSQLGHSHAKEANVHRTGVGE